MGCTAIYSTGLMFCLFTSFLGAKGFVCDPNAGVCEETFNIGKKVTMYDAGKGGYFYPAGGNIYRSDDTNMSDVIDHSDILTTDGWEQPRVLVVVNGTMPGPSLVVYRGQRLRIHVKNNLFSDTTTIHWHGIPQRGTPFMDGVPFATQCPILPGQTFTYDFTVPEAGTYFYHAHVGFQRSSGVFGALIVKERDKEMEELTMTIQDWNHDRDPDLDFLTLFSPMVKNRVNVPRQVSFYGEEFWGFYADSVLINGRGRHYPNASLWGNNGAPLTVFNVKENTKYRLRIIGAQSYYSMRVSVDGHVLQMVAMDGFDIQPIVAESVSLHPGERIDVILHTNQSMGSYWIRVETMTEPAIHGEAILRYNGASIQEPVTSRENCSAESQCTIINCPYNYYTSPQSIRCINVQHLLSARDDDPAPEPSQASPLREYFLNLDFNMGASISGVRYVHPGVAALAQPNQIDQLCKTCGKNTSCFCTHSLPLQHNSIVQMVLTNMGRTAEQSHSMHIHGYTFYLLKMGFAMDNQTTGAFSRQNEDIDCDDGVPTEQSRCNRPTWSNSSWLGGGVPGLELQRPIRKDTITVPKGGYAVIRFKADNPGVWAVHCHVEQGCDERPPLKKDTTSLGSIQLQARHNVEGMFMLLNNSFRYHPSPPTGFPSCHGFPPLVDHFTGSGTALKILNAADFPLKGMLFLLLILNMLS